MRQYLTGRVIAAMMAAAVALGVGAQARANDVDLLNDKTLMNETTLMSTAHVYHLRLQNEHTGESTDIVYRVGDLYIPTALDQLNGFLRDRWTGAVTHYDPREFDLLHSIMAKLGRPDGVINVVCGYRSAWTNHLLRTASRNSGVAEHSQHIEGRAIDIRVPGVSTVKLRDTALSMDAGGVGYYPKSQFVHVDVGPVREWSFGARTRHAKLRTAKYSKHRHGRKGVIRHMGD
ncbi:DUF882 domain-containing protein [Granulicella arctica]|uniref:Murein endopeptidase K n=1 Tax=Granulicella arctica TaxID=940613 RepID=A0A7Y9TS85_9BACT|nr:DUF882 domain-containing protein [Granulicella arctica]NYF78838.1 uncharacterized protein YcbK (DUF882 family) [Granulicella arctica]